MWGFWCLCHWAAEMCFSSCHLFGNAYCFLICCRSLEVGDGEHMSSTSEQRVIAQGFGKLYPSIQASQQQGEHSEEEEELSSDVISRKELEKGRLSRDGKWQPTDQPISEKYWFIVWWMTSIIFHISVPLSDDYEYELQTHLHVKKCEVA